MNDSFKSFFSISFRPWEFKIWSENTSQFVLIFKISEDGLGYTFSVVIPDLGSMLLLISLQLENLEKKDHSAELA